MLKYSYKKIVSLIVVFSSYLKLKLQEVVKKTLRSSSSSSSYPNKETQTSKSFLKLQDMKSA